MTVIGKISGIVADKLISTALVIGALVGLGLMAYPVISDVYASYESKQEISRFRSTVSLMDGEELSRVSEQAESYNAQLAGETPKLTDILPYDKQLSYSTTGNDAVMAWVDIPKINVSLPVYHGTESETLSFGIGHLDVSSLPVGGLSTHTVLTAHSGMASASMFDEIRRLEPGDLFTINALGKELVYEVRDTEVVLPEEIDSLKIVPGEDLATLMTCTPYGVNDHRLLVHGFRTAKEVVPDTILDDVIQSVSGRTMPFAIATIVMFIFAAAALGSLARAGNRRPDEMGDA